MQRYEEITEQVRNKRKFMRNKKGTLPGRIPFSIMREMGLEPTRAYTHKILSLACLPIPALPRNEDYDTIFKKNCQHFLKNIHKKIFSKICKNMIDRKPLL